MNIVSFFSDNENNSNRSFHSNRFYELLDNLKLSSKSNIQTGYVNSQEKSDLREFIAEKKIPVEIYDELKFDFTEIIGKGKFSQVELVVYKKEYSRMALKFPISKDNQENEENLLREMRILTIINSINERNHFVEFSKLLQKNDTFIIEMKYGEGTMRTLIKLHYDQTKNQLYSEEQLLFILKYLVDGLEILHQNKIVHMDIKPENFIFDYTKFKYGDFGQSFVMNDIGDESIWRGGGTKLYYPPEIEEIEKIKENFNFYPYKYDVYCLAIAILEMMGFNLKDSIKKNKICDNLQKIFSDKFGPGKYEILCPILAVMLTKEPKNRISSQELKEYLKSCKISETTFHNRDFQNLLLSIKIPFNNEITENRALCKYSNLFDISFGLFKSQPHLKYPTELCKYIEERMKKQKGEQWKNWIKIKTQLSEFYKTIFLNFSKVESLSENETTDNLYSNAKSFLNLIFLLQDEFDPNFLKQMFINLQPYSVKSEDFKYFEVKKTSKPMVLDESIIKELQDALKKSFDTSNIENQLAALFATFGIALFHKRNGNLEIALSFLKQSSIYCEEIFGETNTMISYILIHISQIHGSTFAHKKKLQLANDCSRKANQICKYLMNNPPTIGNEQEYKHLLALCLCNETIFGINNFENQSVIDMVSENYNELILEEEKKEKLNNNNNEFSGKKRDRPEECESFEDFTIIRSKKVHSDPKMHEGLHLNDVCQKLKEEIDQKFPNSLKVNKLMDQLQQVNQIFQ